MTDPAAHLDQLGTPEARARLAGASALCIGAGGLGSPVAYYLAAAGVGRIGLVDMDDVDLSNLQRQILHTTPDIGRPKVESGADKLRRLNPQLQVQTYREPFTSANAAELIAGYDVVVDGSDNFPTRYLANDACVLAAKPLVHGAIFRFDGQVLVVHPGHGPCYRCLFPAPPPPGTVPTCAEAGVIGVLPGFVGAVMAAEAVKLLLGVPAAVGKLLLYSALELEVSALKIRRNPACPLCGEHPSIAGLIDYEAFCAGPNPGNQ